MNANYDPPHHQPRVSTRECGCVFTEVNGHTNVRFCAACREAHFARAGESPNNLDLVGG